MTAAVEVVVAGFAVVGVVEAGFLGVAVRALEISALLEADCPASRAAGVPRAGEPGDRAGETLHVTDR